MKHVMTSGMIAFLIILSSSLILAEDEEPLVGDRPDLTEGATTVGHLRLQIETGFGWERFEIGNTEEDFYFMPTLFRLGFGDNFELRLETAAFSKLDINTGPLETSFSGFSPIGIGMKYNFVEGENLGDPTFGILLAVELPSGTDEFETEDSSVALKLLASWDFNESLSLGTNVGFTTQKDVFGDNYYAFLGTASLGFGLSDQIGAFAEVAFNSDDTGDGDSSALFDAGLTFLVNKDLQFDVAAGTGITGDFAPDFFMTSGVIVRF